MRSRRRRKKRNKVVPIFLGIVLCLGVFTCAYGLTSGWWFPGGGGGPVDLDMETDENDNTVKIEGFNILLLGTDDREAGDSYSRTDTIIVLNYNDEENRMSMLSIPRDTRVQIPGYGINKINSANVFGGPELVTKTVSQFIDVPIQYYVLTNFYGFKDIVDALGGVTLDVEKDMYHSEKAYGGKYNINLKKGEQLLDGEKALQYVRYRGDAYGDITRTGRQLKFLQALAREVMQPKTITKLHKLVPEIYENVETNIGLSQLIKLAKAGKDLDSVELVTQTLPGYFLDTDEGSFWAVDRDQARLVAAALFEEGKVVKEIVQGPTVNTKQPKNQDTGVMVSQNHPVEESSGANSASQEQDPGFVIKKHDYGDSSGVHPSDVVDPGGDGSVDSRNGSGGEFPEFPEEDTEFRDGSDVRIPDENTEFRDDSGESAPPGGLPEGLPYNNHEDSGSNANNVEIIIDIRDKGAST